MNSCRWCGVEQNQWGVIEHQLDGFYIVSNESECERTQLRKLCDDLIAVARKVGSGMPILSDGVVERANWLASRRNP